MKINSEIREKQVQLIHIAKKQLSLDDDMYRDVLQTLTGKRSCADMDFEQRSKVIDHFKSKGFKLKQKTKGRKPTELADNREKMWGQIQKRLRELGKPIEYADSIALSIAKKERCELCDYAELRKVLGAIERHWRAQNERA